MSKPALVAIYARVSTSEQNPESQLLALRGSPVLEKSLLIENRADIVGMNSIHHE